MAASRWADSSAISSPSRSNSAADSRVVGMSMRGSMLRVSLLSGRLYTRVSEPSGKARRAAIADGIGIFRDEPHRRRPPARFREPLSRHPRGAGDTRPTAQAGRCQAEIAGDTPPARTNHPARPADNSGPATMLNCPHATHPDAAPRRQNARAPTRSPAGRRSRRTQGPIMSRIGMRRGPRRHRSRWRRSIPRCRSRSTGTRRCASGTTCGRWAGRRRGDGNTVAARDGLRTGRRRRS